MQQATGNELLGILDLDNDIDFETAYQMLSSNFDDQMSAHIHENTFSATSPPLLTHELGIIPNVATVQPSHVETIPADNQTHHAPLHTHAHYLNHNPHQPSMGFDQTLGLKLSPSSSGLLSTNESNAIEQFLDNLISQDMMSSNASMNSDSHLHIRSPKKQHRYTELNQRYPETHPHSNTGSYPQTQQMCQLSSPRGKDLISLSAMTTTTRHRFQYLRYESQTLIFQPISRTTL